MQEVLSRIAWVRRLSAAHRERLAALVAQFLDRVVIDGDGGVSPTADERVAIAAACAILYVGRPEWRFPPVVKVTLTPWRFDTNSRPATDGNAVGVAWPNGLVDMSHKDFVHSFQHPDDGYNVAIHEFTHMLDYDAGHVDGVPCNMSLPHVAPWLTILTRAFETAESSPLGKYAGTKLSETFAVAAENFFERPRVLREHDPELYRILADVFQQDPAAAAAE